VNGFGPVTVPVTTPVPLMVDSAAVAGWAPKAPNGSNKSSATIKDFLRLRMDLFLQAAVSSIAVPRASDVAPEALVTAWRRIRFVHFSVHLLRGHRNRDYASVRHRGP
jgi:hypothetical protein